MTFNIENKTALVTGANRGIGLAITKSFLKHGAKKVYLAVRNPSSVDGLISEYGDRVQALPVDVSDKNSIIALAKNSQDVDVVVNNAGVLQTVDSYSPDAETALQYEFNVNTLGLLRVAQAFAPILADKASSAFVQLNSVASIKNFAPFTTYSASKAASYSLTQGLKDSWASQGTQVLSVHPGPIDTDMAKQAGFEESDTPEVVAEGIVQALASGQFHLFPDSFAKQIEGAYQSFATQVIEAPAQSE